MSVAATPSTVHRTVDGQPFLELPIKITKFDITQLRGADVYKLVVFGSSDVQETAELNVSASIPNPPTPVTIKYRMLSGRVPRYLHFALFVTSPEFESSAVVTVQLAQGSLQTNQWLGVSGKQPIEVKLVDIENKVQALLSVLPIFVKTDLVVLTPPSDTSYVIPKPASDLANRLMKEAQSTFDKLSVNDSLPTRRQMAFFSYTTFTPTGTDELPLLAFVYGARRVAMFKPIAEAFLLNMLKLAGSNLGYDVSDNKKDSSPDKSAFGVLSSDVDKGDWLAETCTIYFRMLFYTHDTIRVGDKKYHRPVDEESDQWSRLNFFPSDGYTGYDCEDGAEWILEFLYLLMKGEYSNPNLKAMQAFANQYVPFFTLGFLHSRSATGRQEYVPHAYVCLLDRRFASGVTLKGAEKYKPAIVLESTTYTQGTWSPERIFDNDFDSTVSNEKSMYIAKTSFLENFVDKNETRKWRKSVKTIANVSLITSQRMYGSVWMLASAQIPVVGANTEVAKQFFLTDANSSRMGVSPIDLYQYSKNVVLNQVSEVPEAQFGMFETMLRETPRISMPVFNPNQQINYKPFEALDIAEKIFTWRYFVRSVDLKDAEAVAKFKEALCNSDAFTVRGLQITQIESDCKNASVHIYDLSVTPIPLPPEPEKIPVRENPYKLKQK